MKHAKHTPGPWIVENPSLMHVSDSQGRALVLGQNSGYGNNPETRVFERWDRPEPEIQANARLIAAAPEMLAILEDAQEILTEYGGAAVELLERIDAIVLKAGGSK